LLWLERVEEIVPIEFDVKLLCVQGLHISLFLYLSQCEKPARGGRTTAAVHSYKLWLGFRFLQWNGLLLNSFLLSII
jgi:hypothetical protein